MSFQVKATLAGSISAALAASTARRRANLLHAVTAGTGDLKQGLRADTLAAGLSPKLAQTWQSKVYTNKGSNPAGLVYSKAPAIIESFARGVTIYPTGGHRLLALPTKDTPRRANGRALTPAEVETRFGKKLRFVLAADAKGTHIGHGSAVAFLILDGVVAGSSGRVRNATATQLKRDGRGKSRPVQAAVMFELQTSVTEPKLFNLPARAAAAGDEVGALIAGAEK